MIKLILDTSDITSRDFQNLEHPVHEDNRKEINSEIKCLSGIPFKFLIICNKYMPTTLEWEKIQYNFFFNSSLPRENTHAWVLM